MPRLYYDDGTITVTESEIRAKGYTLYLSNVSSVSVASFTLGKLMLLPLSFCVLPFAFFLLLFRTLALPLLIGFLPLLLLFVGACFLRKTRILLQTTGGPVIAGQAFGFGSQTAELDQYERMKQAIEAAKADSAKGTQ